MRYQPEIRSSGCGPAIDPWQRFRALARRLMLGAAVWLMLGPRFACAQAEVPPPPPPQPVVTVSRSWYFEAVIVAAMMCLALFVVCRSSRRN